MRIKSLFLILPVLLFFSSQSFAQICSSSSQPYDVSGLNYSRMHGDDFKATPYDLPFIAADEHKLKYSQFWVNAEVLNIRSGPGLEYKIISETYFGEHVFAFAKKGQWIAIRPEFISEEHGVNMRPQWVNTKYLSALHIKERVNAEVLKKKCGFEAYGTYHKKINALPERYLRQLGNVYEPCTAVRNYLSNQRLPDQPHSYVQEYESWRKLQNDPNEYSPPPCYNSK